MAFIGGAFAKFIEYQSLFGDQLYFLRSHKHFWFHTLAYGVVAIACFMLVQLGVYNRDIIPDLYATTLIGKKLLVIAATSFFTGFGSKAMLDVPLFKRDTAGDQVFSLGVIIKLLYPTPQTDAEAYISHQKTNYFYNASCAMNNMGKTTDDLYETLDLLLRNIKEYQGEAGSNKYHTFFKNIEKEPDLFGKLMFVYRNLGRKHFENVMNTLGVKYIPRHKRIEHSYPIAVASTNGQEKQAATSRDSIL